MSGVERRKVCVDYFTIADGDYAASVYESTFSIEQLSEWTRDALVHAREQYRGEGVEWRVAVEDCELRLVGFKDEPEAEWKARVEKSRSQKRKQEEKERSQLKELLKKYPDIPKGEK